MDVGPGQSRRRGGPAVGSGCNHESDHCSQTSAYRGAAATPALTRSDRHWGASVTTRARPARDIPATHRASDAEAEREKTVLGCSHSHQRRRNAPCRTPGCNLSPALDLDVDPVEPLLAGRPGEDCPRKQRRWLAGVQGAAMSPLVAGPEAAKS